MNKKLVILFFCLITLCVFKDAGAQCSVCTKTASQLGSKAAKGLNAGIIYLMLTPFLIGGYLGYRWWKSDKSE